MTLPNKTLCIINNIPSPYRRALFDEIARKADASDITFSVLYLAKSETVRNWSVKLKNFETVLPIVWQKRNKRTPTSDTVINMSFLSRTLRPQFVILFGYNYPTYLVVAFVRAMLRKPTYLFCESTLTDKTMVGWKIKLKSSFLHGVFSKFIVPGKRSTEYLIAHNISQKDIFFARNSSDLLPNDPPIIEPVSKLRLVYVGRLSPEKRIVEFAQTFTKLGKKHNLTIVGTGPDAAKINAIAEAHSNIDALGSVEPEQLTKILESHHVLVLVSDSEPWGLVVNEAINFGLALLLSRQVGSGPELLNENGQYLDHFTKEALETAIKDIKTNIMRYREQSLRIARDTTVEMQAASFLDVVRNEVNDDI